MVESILILLGLSVGSFLNVCIYRIPKGISLVNLRSFCPSCSKQLRWFELIPIFSYVLQKGKCRSCCNKVSTQYPIIELISAVVFVLLYFEYGFTIKYAESVLLYLIACVIANIDWLHLIIPNSVLVIGFCSILGIRIFKTDPYIIDQILFGVIASGILLIVLLIGNHLLKKESMGMGDVKLAGFIGFVIGLPLFLTSLWTASIIGAIYGLFLKSESQNDVKIPFGSILVAVSTIVVFFRDKIEELLYLWIS